MRDWLLSLLLCFPHGNPFGLLAAVAVTHCLCRMKLILRNVGHEIIIKLLEMLRVYPESQNKLCPDYKLLCDSIPKDNR